MNICLAFFRFVALSCMLCNFLGAVSIPYCPGSLPKARYTVKLYLHAEDQIHSDADLYDWLRFQIDTPLARVGGLRIESGAFGEAYKTVILAVEGQSWSKALDRALARQLERFEKNFKNSLVACISCS